MPKVSDYTPMQWELYACKLDEFANGNTVGDARHLNDGTCCYCELSQPELELPAYNMFGVLEGITQIARDLSSRYDEALFGRTEFRVKAAAELAAIIRKEILRA